jgi:hypothetical protein
MAFLLHPGTRRDAPDSRDRRFRPRLGTLPPRADLSPFCAPPYMQRRIMSCSANALAGALRLCANRERAPIAAPSRLFLYYNARASLGEANDDCGTTVRAAIKAAAAFGAPPEPLWRYRTENVLKKPPRVCYQRSDVRAILYRRIARRLDDLHASLAQGDPIVFGITAYVEAFEEASRTGRLRLPRAGTKPMGGHALLAVGYDVKKKAVLARNSLGARFGRDGFFWIDERYFADAELSFDFWSIRSVAPQ